MAEVLLDGLGKRYEHGAWAVREVSVKVADGEFVVLVGPSGCGKSTTLRMIAGLEEVSEGGVFIDGTRVDGVPPKDRDIAMVFQNYALYPHMTVRENLGFALKLRGVQKAEIERRVAEASEILGLGELLGRLPKQLSGGQRQRVAVGRAIVRKPKVFLFDEPLSNLDARMRGEMRSEIKRLHRALHATMVYVTHDQVEAMTMGDRVVVMDRGRVQQVASPMDLYRRPANVFVAGFIGTPPMNVLRGALDCRSGERVVCAGDACRVPVAAGECGGLAGRRGDVMIGFRPEAVSLASGEVGHIRGTVELVEPMGCDTFVHAKVCGQRIVARLSANEEYEPGATISFVIRESQLHFFDCETGGRL